MIKRIRFFKGWLGFYRSFLTTILREIPFGTIQYPLWEYLKSKVAKANKKKKCEPYQSAICGSISGKTRVDFARNHHFNNAHV